MKFLFAFLICLSAALHTFAQADYDERLLDKYPAERLEELAQSHPELIDYWTFLLDHSCKVVDAPVGKSPEIHGEVKLKKGVHPNTYALGLPNPGEHARYYSIRRSDKLLLVLSSAQAAEAYKEYSNKGVGGMP